MSKVATKVVVSLPHALYRAVEQARKKSGKSRSAVMQDALHHWLRQQEQAVLIREYEAGYQKKPESTQEVKAAEASAVQLLVAEKFGGPTCLCRPVGALLCCVLVTKRLQYESW